LRRLALFSSLLTLVALPWGSPRDHEPRVYAFAWKPKIFTIKWKRLPAPAEQLLPLAWPARGTITSPYGVDGYRWHPGVDIGVLRSLRVSAAAPGRVLYAGYATGFAGYGKVVVERSGKYLVVYAHLARVRVRVGERIHRGLRIGTAGCTGWCTGTHLHFEVRRGTRTVNPMRLLG
jgi:murein DD-endopeptidase MepM/ murein hydrolase activator NlpD